VKPGAQARRARHKRNGNDQEKRDISGATSIKLLRRIIKLNKKTKEPGRAHAHGKERCAICQPLPQRKIALHNEEGGDPRAWKPSSSHQS
jgi:hypothetical protein